MDFGIRLPGAGKYAGPEAITAFSQKAEELGFTSLWMTDIVAIPSEIKTPYPHRPDGKWMWTAETPYLNWAMALAWASAATTTIKVGMSALVPVLHHPVDTAKVISSLDSLNGGRTIIGVGVGWMKEQFENLGVPFEKRGARTEEYVRLLKHLWTEDEADFHGQFNDFSGFKIYPKPVASPLPVWWSGNSEAAVRHAAAVAEGWNPVGLSPADMAPKVDLLAKYMDENGRSMSDITLAARPFTEPNRAEVERYAELGVTVTIFDTHFKHADLAGVLGELEDIAADIVEPLRSR